MGSSNEHKRIVTLDVKLVPLVLNMLSHKVKKSVSFRVLLARYCFWREDYSSPVILVSRLTKGIAGRFLHLVVHLVEG